MKLAKLLQQYAGKSNQSTEDMHKEQSAIVSDAIIQEKSSQLLDELPADISEWPEYWREAYEERAAIMEYDGGLPKSEAEKLSEKIQREAYAKK